MDAVETLAHVETLYRRILDLTLRQEAILDSPDVSELPAVVSEKFALLDQAQTLLAALPPEADRNAPAFQRGVEALRAVLADVVASEGRCKPVVAPSLAPPAAPPRRVVAAYGRH
jgi:hypothetical protein